MSMQDPLSDMLTRLRNAQMAGKQTVDMPGSKLKVSVAKVLEQEMLVQAPSSARTRRSVVSLPRQRRDHVCSPALLEFVGKEFGKDTNVAKHFRKAKDGKKKQEGYRDAWSFLSDPKKAGSTSCWRG